MEADPCELARELLRVLRVPDDDKVQSLRIDIALDSPVMLTIRRYATEADGHGIAEVVKRFKLKADVP